MMTQGKVVAVGPGARLPDGTFAPCAVKSGETVVIPEFGGSQIKLEDEEYTLYRDSELLGVLADK